MRWQTGLFAILLALAAAGGAQGQAKPAAPAASLIENARKAMAEGDHGEALEQLDRARAAGDVTPAQRPVVAYLRGVAFYRDGNAIGALTGFREALADPALPADMRVSATAAIGLLSGRAATARGGVAASGFSYETLMLRQDLQRMEHDLANPSREQDKDPEARAERYAMLAREYASRGEPAKARELGAKSLDEARKSGSGFRVGDALMRQYLLAQMHDDTAAAATYLSQGIAQFERVNALRIVPGYLSDGVKRSESRRDAAEACRHRINLDSLYSKIGGDDLAADAATNKAALQTGGCSS